MSDWGGPCRKCGHPSAYHGMTFCRCEAGSTSKKMCDCDGYDGDMTGKQAQGAEGATL